MKNKHKKVSKYIDLKILLAVGLFASAIIFGAHIEGLKAENGMILPSIREKQSVEEYVMGEVESHGLNKYKVWSLINCESKWSVEAKHNNNKLGIDRGLFQINDRFHREVSNSCAYNYKCATKEAIRIIKERGLAEWTCGKNL